MRVWMATSFQKKKLVPAGGDHPGLETGNERVKRFRAQRAKNNIWRLNQPVENEIPVDGHDGLGIGGSVRNDIREFQRRLERAVVAGESNDKDRILGKVAKIDAKLVVRGYRGAINGRVGACN